MCLCTQVDTLANRTEDFEESTLSVEKKIEGKLSETASHLKQLRVLNISTRLFLLVWACKQLKLWDGSGLLDQTNLIIHAHNCTSLATGLVHVLDLTRTNTQQENVQESSRIAQEASKEAQRLSFSVITRSLCVCDVVSVLACWRWHMICKNSFVHRVSTNSDAIQIRLHQYVAHMNEEMRSKADLKDVKLLASHSGLYVMHFSHSLYILIFFDWRNRQTHCRFTHHSWTTFCHLGWPAQGFQHFLPVCIQPYDYTWNRQKIVCTHHLYIQENTTHKIMHTKTHKDTHTFVHKHVIPYNN